MAARPRIAITGSGRGWDSADFWLYAAIRQAGGEPVPLTPKHPQSPETIHGILFSGGTDVEPHHYGGEAKPGYRYEPDRDALEADWLDRALDRDLPILAICRGLQLVNVRRGGSLHFDARQVHHARDYPGPGIWPAISFRKRITVEPGSRLAKITRRASLWVNALNTQAIDRLGNGLRVAAREANGIAQAIEDLDHRFLVGVQFHPEFLLHRGHFRGLFRALVHAVHERHHPVHHVREPIE